MRRVRDSRAPPCWLISHDLLGEARVLDDEPLRVVVPAFSSFRAQISLGIFSKHRVAHHTHTPIHRVVHPVGL
jgi:hypothetical protein